MSVKHVDLFAGIGGFSIAAERVGWETVAYCETDQFCRRVLERRFDRVRWISLPGVAMAFDIYGQNLRTGHCEVHPHVHEEYPCSVCLSDGQRKRRERQDYDQMLREQEEAYYAQLWGDTELLSWGEGWQLLREVSGE